MTPLDFALAAASVGLLMVAFGFGALMADFEKIGAALLFGGAGCAALGAVVALISLIGGF